MPYTKKTEPDFVKVKRTLLGFGVNATALADAIEVSQPTARKKLNRPELFTLADLKKVSLRMHIPIEELRSSIGWQ